MSLKTPIIGGVRDGDEIKLPQSAEPGQYVIILRNKEQETLYTLRQDGLVIALVAEGMKWPFLEAAAA